MYEGLPLLKGLSPEDLILSKVVFTARAGYLCWLLDFSSSCRVSQCEYRGAMLLACHSIGDQQSGQACRRFLLRNRMLLLWSCTV